MVSFIQILLGGANAESRRTPSCVTLPPSAISVRSLEGQETIYCRLIQLYGNEALSVVGTEQGDRHRRSMDMRSCACPALFSLKETELFMF